MPNPLAQISKAEVALANASDIVDILELRAKAKAIEALAVAQGLEDTIKQLRIFQLKAERKAGLWLEENIQHGGDTRALQRVTLDKVGV